jgi:hypothetical protein
MIRDNQYTVFYFNISHCANLILCHGEVQEVTGKWLKLDEAYSTEHPLRIALRSRRVAGHRRRGLDQRVDGAIHGASCVKKKKVLLSIRKVNYTMGSLLSGRKHEVLLDRRQGVCVREALARDAAGMS